MNSFGATVPLLLIVGGALLVFLLEAFLKKENKNYLAYVSLFALIGCGILSAKAWNAGRSYFDGMLRLDNPALFLTFLFLIAVAFVILIGMKYISMQDANHGEFYGLLLLALSGLMIMVSSTNLIVIFLGLEVLSVSSYALAGLKRKDDKSSESAIKYFLMGSFASAFLVFGMAILFGTAQTLDISGLIAFFKTGPDNQVLSLVGFGLVLVGLAFKIAIVPFHMWAPDVYEGAPTPVTAFFSVGPKAAGFAVLIRLLAPYWNAGFGSAKLFAFLWALAALTTLVGSLIALRQKNIKRMLAYSSIANGGYMLIAVLAGDGTALLFFLTTYVFMSIGAFGSLIALTGNGREYNELEDFAGIGFKYPWIGAIFAVFLLSLAGFPPTGGFLAKFYVFVGAVRQGLTSLVLIAVLASLISVYYYLRIVVYMYMREPEREVSIELENPALYLVLFLSLYGVLQLGIFPGNVLYLIKQAVSALF
ncbi:MAG: NADH-quinone oxidoreductase subunit N [Candidatus Aminicenantes bacterium]|nr:NADH-quinone oxidoreductase subunit N [Candidatus Aminicenantes bacterium]